MDYEKVLELLPDYVRGRLSTAEAEQVRLAVEGSETLQREVEALGAYYAALATQAPVRAPGDFLAKVNAKIDAPQGLLRRVLLPVWPKVPLELAGLAVTVALVVMLFNPFTMRNVPQEVLQQPPASGQEQSLREQPELSTETAEMTRAEPSAPALAKDRKGAPAAARKPAPAPRPRSDIAAAPTARAGSAAGGAAPGSQALREEERFVSDDGFAPQPPPRDENRTELAAAPAPAAAPSAALGFAAEPAKSKAAETDMLALERRKLKRETEAVSVMTLRIDSRRLDRSDVDDGRKSRAKSRAAAGFAAEAKSQDAAAVTYRSLEEKAFALVEDVIRGHGGACTLRSTMDSPKPQRTYVVSLPREAFDATREELRTLGVVNDLDLNLDASDAARIYFRLGVTVE